MDNYSNAKALSIQMIDGLNTLADLVGSKDSGKERTYRFVPGLEMNESVKFLNSTVENIKEGIFQVMFTGAFSSGKSTLLNALMKKDILASNIKPETAIITKIIFGKREKKVIVVKKATDSATGEHLREEMSVDEFFHNYRVSQDDPEKFVKMVDYAILQLPEEGIGGSMVQFVDSPGTQNSAADNDIAHGFIEEADAVVFLINAVEPFNQDDKAFIAKNYAGKNMTNLFFVINRFDCVNDNEISNLKNHVQEQLRDVFTRPDGSFDQGLYNSRVYYTNAYGSLMARTNRPIKIMGQAINIKDSTTGVPDFEKAISRFLTDDGKDKAAFNKHMTKLARIYVEADAKIQKILEQYEKSSQALMAERDRIEVNKKLYESYISQIADCCHSCVKGIIDDAKNGYDSMINRVDSGWTNHFTENQTKLPMRDVMGLIFDSFKSEAEKQKSMERRLQPLADAIQEYIKPETEKMAENLIQCFEVRLNTLERQLTDISKALNSLDDSVSFDDVAKSLADFGNENVNVGEGHANTSLFQVILGVISGDPETVIGGVAGGKKTSSVVVETLLKTALEYIAIYVVSWPVGLAMLAGRVFMMVKQGKANQRSGALQILEQMKPGVLQSLRENKDRYAMEIESKMSAITRGGNVVSQSFQKELDSHIKQLNDTIEQLEKNSSASKQERKRTDAIKKKMVEVISGMNRAINGKSLNEDGIKKMA